MKTKYRSRLAVDKFVCHKLLRELIKCAVKRNLIHRIDVVNAVNKHDLVLPACILNFVLHFLVVLLVRQKN